MDISAQSERPIEYWLGTQSGTRLNPVHKLSEEEWALLDRAVLAILNTQPPFHYRLVESNYTHLITSFQFISTTISLGRDFAPGGDRTRLGEAVMTSVVNWLTSMKMYLDHQGTQLHRTYGPTSSEYLTFHAATADAFDTHVGYRFAYKFRNYVQHCGAPLSSIQVSLPPPGSSPRFRQATRLLLDREALLREFHKWGPIVQPEIEDMPAEFELLPLLTDAMIGLREINRACQEFLIDHALTQAPLLAAALLRVRDIEGNPTLFKVEHGEDGGMRYSPRLMQSEAVAKLLDVVDNRTTRDSLWAEPEPSRSSSLDPEIVRRVFHRSNRGVQIILAWLQEGGNTPHFDSVVTSIFNEDQGIEPAVTGLINASVVLANMLSILLGTTAPALIASLLDQYNDWEEETKPGTNDR